MALPTALAPTPESATHWGLLVALSTMARAAARLPLADGLKMTLTAHEAPGAIVDPQLFVWVNSVAFVPDKVMPLIVLSGFL